MRVYKLLAYLQTAYMDVRLSSDFSSTFDLFFLDLFIIFLFCLLNLILIICLHYKFCYMIMDLMQANLHHANVS